ncbi:hypothetical protein NEOLI_002594 [Neolecta irregularis DAH-3]|uniref:Uncharacterized protein n=1 Tax=Neolecta irregularis (strain DAH-3) TaxID=1198029 RepID=A0A1U7LIR1_NEOID|nr:hypothetical protein NEOLI_002594 [Neolecta irregularis DAH-3]|eukprot:OLL22534.1 hypothetical protein NEOLI_002594 [Neolecta irregularis DAH-3]
MGDKTPRKDFFLPAIAIAFLTYSICKMKPTCIILSVLFVGGDGLPANDKVKRDLLSFGDIFTKIGAHLGVVVECVGMSDIDAMKTCGEKWAKYPQMSATDRRVMEETEIDKDIKEVFSSLFS